MLLQCAVSGKLSSAKLTSFAIYDSLVDFPDVGAKGGFLVVSQVAEVASKSTFQMQRRLMIMKRGKTSVRLTTDLASINLVLIFSVCSPLVSP